MDWFWEVSKAGSTWSYKGGENKVTYVAQPRKISGGHD